jgi:uncharacterized protein YcbX
MRHVELSTAEIRALKQRLRQTKELREFRPNFCPKFGGFYF